MTRLDHARITKLLLDLVLDNWPDAGELQGPYIGVLKAHDAVEDWIRRRTEPPPPEPSERPHPSD